MRRQQMEKPKPLLKASPVSLEGLQEPLSCDQYLFAPVTSIYDFSVPSTAAPLELMMVMSAHEEIRGRDCLICCDTFRVGAFYFIGSVDSWQIPRTQLR